MKPLAAEWVTKAEGDYATARRELRARRQPNFDAACFHAQQCAEKYLKGLLQEQRLPIPRTHNLEALAKSLLAVHPALGPLIAAMRTLGAYAVETRYPGRSADRALAKEAIELCTRIRRACRKALKARR
jgi:HEPN domain-containing protein